MTAAAEATIRAFREADRPGLVRLWAEAFPDDPPRSAPERMIDAALRVHPELLFVAELDGAVVGAVIAGFDGMRGWIYHLAVVAAHRRRGIATRLMRAAGEALRTAGCPKVNLQVRAENRGVVAFYRAIGFEVEERISMGRRLE
ncbi:MAG TPA: GNAT family acetyltransferase [Polyangia bacterium]|nr:GNAT family acetyltransferase [Polyangia bacterium]